MNNLKTCTLHNTEAGSDKLYIVHLTQGHDGLCTVTFQYGRRGGALKAGEKTTVPVALAEAEKIYDGLVLSKVRGGYVIQDGGEGAAAVVGIERAGRDTGLRVQLLTPVDREDAHALVEDPRYMMQPKHDGERRLLVIDAHEVTGANRRGLVVAIPEAIAAAAALLGSAAGRTVLDGEQVGDQFIAFDVIEREGRDLRTLPAVDRFSELVALIPWPDRDAAVVTRTHCWLEAAGRDAAYQDLIDTRAEGAVFKRMGAPYREVRDPEAIKVKFVETVTCRVIAGDRPGKRSIGVELMDPTTAIWQCVGNVSVPGNQPVPAIGAVVEVAYLYASVPGAKLQQPELRGVRGDVGTEACTLGQLKYKTPPKRLAA